MASMSIPAFCRPRPLSREAPGRPAGRARSAGFSLIELMVAVAIVAIIAAIAYPQYQNHVMRGFRAEAQQWLQDYAQMQEQYFLDRRAYAVAGLGNGPGQLPMQWPPQGMTIDTRYQAPAVLAIAGPPAGYVVCLQPLAGGAVASQADGGVCLNSAGLRWRDINTNGTFEAGTDRGWADR